jgi:hypothetical protein
MRITNKTNISNNTKIVLASQKRHLGRLTQEEYQRGKKRTEKNKNTKKDNKVGGGKL